MATSNTDESLAQAEELVLINARVPEELRRAVKSMAGSLGTTVQEIVTTAIRREMERRRLESVA